MINQSVKCNYNPNLLFFSKIRNRVLRVLMWLVIDRISESFVSYRYLFICYLVIVIYLLFFVYRISESFVSCRYLFICYLVIVIYLLFFVYRISESFVDIYSLVINIHIRAEHPQNNWLCTDLPNCTQKNILPILVKSTEINRKIVNTIWSWLIYQDSEVNFSVRYYIFSLRSFSRTDEQLWHRGVWRTSMGSALFWEVFFSLGWIKENILSL